MQLQHIAALLAMAGQGMAASFFLTSPISGTQWKAGDVVQINWIKNDKPVMANPKTITIDLVNGDANNANFVATVVTGLGASFSSYSYKVPTTLTSGTDYFLRMAAVDGSSVDYNFSARFSIQGGSGTAPSTAKNNTSNAKTPSKDETVVGSASTAQVSALGAAAGALFALLA